MANTLYSLKATIRYEWFEIRYGPATRVLGWSIRTEKFVDDKPIRIEYVCPHCGYVFDPIIMRPGWKGCHCGNCDKQSDFTVSWSLPHGYRNEGGNDDN